MEAYAQTIGISDNGGLEEASEMVALLERVFEDFGGKGHRIVTELVVATSSKIASISALLRGDSARRKISSYLT